MRKAIILTAGLIMIPASLLAAPKRYSAELEPRSNSKVHGVVTFEETEEGVKITGNIENLDPGQHGIHLHEKGDCSAPDASSAGEHFNPEKTVHGAPVDTHHHAGDFGNLTADDDGKAEFELVDNGLEFQGDKSIVGKALIIHAKADDLKSQPSGNSGERIACGIVK